MITRLLLVWSLAAMMVSFAAAQSSTQQPPAAQPALTISQVLDRALSGTEWQFTGIADAMPEDKYSFVPTSGEFKGVRTFAEQVKHVAFLNYRLFSAILGEAPPADMGGENGPASLKTKAEIMKYLRDSFVLGHRAMASINAENLVAPIKGPFGPATRLALANLVSAHCGDHYGQLVVYLRMNGIIPPASRR